MSNQDYSGLEPIQLYWNATVPNPAKVVIVLEELRIPYTGRHIVHTKLKEPEFEAINPNGRLPAIYDPNKDITIWESGAIITYLIDTYDTAYTLTYTSFPEKYHLIQWQHFQASGQGPYFGQAAWFTVFHPEQVESAKERYRSELKRVVDVLDKWLAKRAKEAKDEEKSVYLVGDKVTYADLSFVPWNALIEPFIMKGQSKEVWDPKTEFPHYFKWHTALTSRPSVQKAMSVQKEEDLHL